MGVKVRFVKGKWCIEVDHDCRRTRKAIGTSKEAAVTVAKQVELQLAMNDLGVFGISVGKGEAFADYADRWWVDGETGRKATYHRWLGYNITDHLNPTLGPLKIADITRADARALVKAVRDKGAKIHVVKGAVRVASAVLSQAVDDGLRQANPFFRMGKHTRSADELVNDAKVRALSREQVKHLLATVRDHWPEYYTFYLTALRTGMRLGELLALKWDAVHVDTRTINVRLNYTGNKFTSVKNTKRRDVDMSDQLAAQLPVHKVAMQTRALKTGSPLPDLLFGSAEGDPLDADNFRKRVHLKAMKKAGLDFTIHELRHTFASLLLMRRESPAYVKEQMGHSSIQVTIDVYGHWIPSSDRRAVNSLDDDAAIDHTGTEGK